MYPVFVDNIANDVRTADLRAVFNRHGDVVEVTIVSDHGFVIFGNPDDALEAIRKVNGQELNGKQLSVDVSKELEDYLHGNKEHSDETRRHRSNGSFEQDRFRGGRGGRDRGRRGWNYRGGRARGFRGRVRRGYGRFSPTSRNERRSRSPREDSYQYQQQRNHSPTSRRYSVGDEKRRSFSPMVKTYPPPDGDNRYHHFKGNRGSRGKPKASPPRRGQNIFPSRESRSPSARRSPSRSRTGSPPRHDSSHHSNARKRSRGTQSRSRSPSREDRGRRASEITKPSRHSLESASDSNKGSKMDNFGFFTASNFVETKIEKPKSPLQPLPATSPITSTSANDTTSTSATNDDEVERGEHRKDTSSSTHKINNSSSPYHLNSNQQKEDTKIPATIENNEKSNKDKPSNKSSPSPDKQVDLRELLKSKKKKDKSRSIDAAFDSPPVKRKKSSSTSSSLKNRTNIQIKVERESESVRTIMVGAKQKSKQIKVFEETEIKSELDMTQKSELPPPSARAGMPPTILPASESIKTEKLDMEKHEKLFVGNLFNPVENEDIELLFDEFGPIKQIKRYEKHAIVTIECSTERADEACKALDHNNWMDNWIRVKKNKYLHSKEEADAIYKSKQSAGERNMNRWYSQHDNRDQITLFREDDEDELTYRDRNPSSESTGIQEEREPKKPKPTSTKAELDTMFINSFSKSELEDNAKDDNMENRCENADTNASPDAENTKDPEEVELAEKLKKRKSMERKVRSFKIYCATSNKNFMSDIVEVFTRFGAVKSNDWDGPCIAIDLESTEKKAVQCIFETNKIRYKGQELRVKFKDGTEEDKAEFHEIYEVEFRNYPKDLVPTNASQIRSAMTATEIKQSSKKTDELPIGVLPQSNSLGAFGTPGIPDQGMLTSILQKARENMIKSDNASNTNSPNLSIAATKAEPLYNAYAIATGPLMTKDPQYLSEVEGNVHSVNSRIVLIQFHTGSSWRLAKLSPGTMYVDGKKCLGSLINNNSFHSWPKALKHFLYQGAKVKMDVKRMYNEEDIAEVKELCGEHVTYSTPLVWKINTSKPTEKDITISRVKQKSAVLKGSVTSIYPKWGVIKTSKGEVFFEVNHVYIDNKKLSKQVSLLNHIEKGDTLAVQCVEVPDYLEMSEIARSAPGFAGRTDTLKYHARLVWHLNAEVDPYSVRNCESSEFSDIDCNFLTTSTTLNKPLPSDRDILSRPTKGWTGRVEEIHLPAGGVILLDENLNLKPYERYAYFHRSRLYANGSKISSSKSLDDEIVPGDRVTVDVVENMQPGVINKSNAYVASEAYWVALSVHLNSIGRGNAIARSLKMEGLGNVEPPREGQSSNVGVGRIVHFFAPKDNPTEPVTSGVAVLDSGLNAGQRVEFEAGQCEAFGSSLENADLSQIFNYNDPVYIQVKSYNSYCVEKLWVGSRGKRIEEFGPDEVQSLQKYLMDHGLDVPSFNALIRGHYHTRHFLPMGGQILNGKIKCLKFDVNVKESFANRLVIEADVGDTLLIEASRESVYIHGHWMGKADLSYVLEVGDIVRFEFHPVFEKDHRNLGEVVPELPSASLVWLGDEDSRPVYHGQATRPTITPKMDAQLWEFVQKKRMDQKMFRALVEGRLPPKPKNAVDEPIITPTTSADEIKSCVDPETLKMASLLTQMKSSFGDNGMMQAMMLMLANKSSDSSSDTPKPTDQLAQMMKMAEMLNNTKTDAPSVVPPISLINQAVPGPSGLTFPAAGDSESTIKKETSPTNMNTTGSSFQMRIPPKKFN